jgi:hypothetical protein
MTRSKFKYKIKEIIIQDFKRLKMPFIIYVNRDNLFMCSIKLPLSINILLVDKEVFNMNDNAIIGCLVHELCHFENWNIKSERDIDRMVIKKGYGRQLYEFLKYHDSIYEKYTKKDGLTKKEIQVELKKLFRDIKSHPEARKKPDDLEWDFYV